MTCARALEGIFLLVFALLYRPTCVHAASIGDGLNASGLVQDVISRSESPHVFDWREADGEVEIGWGQVSEANNFNTQTYDFAAGFPAGEGSLIRVGLRRTLVYATPSSDDIGRTPYKQAAQMNRYSLYGGYDFGILEGRGMSSLTPHIADLEYAVYACIGAAFNHPNATWVPKGNEKPAPLPGQDAVSSMLSAEAGLRWHVYTPQSLGLYFEAMENLPLGNTHTLHSFAYFSGGLLWAIGVH